jgi:hypothetical protein
MTMPELQGWFQTETMTMPGQRDGGREKQQPRNLGRSLTYQYHKGTGYSSPPIGLVHFSRIFTPTRFRDGWGFSVHQNPSKYSSPKSMHPIPNSIDQLRFCIVSLLQTKWSFISWPLTPQFRNQDRSPFAESSSNNCSTYLDNLQI